MHFLGQDQMHGWQERVGRDIADSLDDSPLQHLAAAADPARRATPDPEPGTGKWPQTKEILNARVGEGYCGAQDRYSTDGALQLLEEYFVGHAYDRNRTEPLLLAVSLNNPHYPYQCQEELFAYYLTRVEPYFEELQQHFSATITSRSGSERT